MGNLGGATKWFAARLCHSDVFEDNMVESKATKFCPRGVLEVEASPRGPPYLGFFYRVTLRRAVMPSRLSVHQSQIQCPTAASCALVYEVLYLWYWVLYWPYSKIQRLMARSRSQSQGRASSRPRPRPGVFKAKAKATKFCPRSVLEVEASPRGPHPCCLELMETSVKHGTEALV